MRNVSIALGIVAAVLGVVYLFVPDHRIAGAGIVAAGLAVCLPALD